MAVRMTTSCADAKYSEELDRIEEALLQIRNLYQAHQQEIHHLLQSKRSHAYYRDVLMARKAQYAFIPAHYRPCHIYLAGNKNACTRSGGCEKPLKDYYIPSGYFSKGRKKVELYEHCTAECGCCIGYTNGYTPHPLFKNSEVSPENEK